MINNDLDSRINRFAYHAKGEYDVKEEDKYNNIILDSFTLSPGQICLMIGGYSNSISLDVDAYCSFSTDKLQDTDYILYFNKSNRCNATNGGGTTTICILEPKNTITVNFRFFNYELEKLYSIYWELVAIKLNKSE